MNKIYKVIYSKAKNCYIVASEIAKSSTKSASGSKKKAAALLCAAVLSGGLSVSAADLNVTYDDDKKAKITLGTDGSTVDILGVAGGKVYEGSTHVASGDDVWQIDQRITGFSASLDSINTGMSKINASLASNLKDITTLQTTTATIKQKVERGYNFQINGIDAKVATPNDNDVNFTNGDHVTITNQNGSLKFSVNDNGKVAAGDTQFVTGDTVNTAITAEATARQTEDDNIKNNIIGTTTDGSYVKAANTVAGNLGALDTQVKSNTDAIAKEVKDRADEITKAKEELNTKISTLDGNAVKYDDADKGTITLAGAEGTTITHVKAGTLSAESTDAVNGSQLFDTNTKLAQEIQDRKDAITKEVSDRDTAIGAAKKEITDKIGTIDANGSYITADGTISSNLTALDTQVKNNQSAIEKEVQDRKDAITGVETKITTLTGNAVQYDDATKGKVTLGGGDTGTTIGNVKAGTLSADSKEAVNGSQLFTTNSNLTQEIADRTAADEAEKTARENADNDIKNNIIGTVADGTYVKASGTIADNLGKLDAGVKANADSITDVRDNVIGTITDGTYIKASDNVAGSLGKLDAGVKANADAITKEVTDRTNEITKAKEELNTKISTLDGNAVKYDDADKGTITLAGAEGTTITHVKAGILSAESTDAVNGSQLFDTNTKLAQEIQDRKDAITKEVSDRDTAIGAAKKEITDKIGTIDANGSYITADGTISSNLTALDTQVKNNQSAIEKEVQDRKDAITGVETKITTLTGNAVQYDDATKGKVTLGGGDTGTTIGNVKAGTLSADSKEAVNGSQLFDTNTKLAQEIQDRKDAITKEVSDRDTAIGAAKKEITDKIGTIDANGSYITADGTISSNLTALDTQVKNNQSAIEKEVQDRKDAITGVETKITTLTGNAVQYDDETKGKVTLGGGENGTTIGNVKAGTLSADSKEAVNGSQLFTTNSNLTQEIADRTEAINDVKDNVIGTITDGTYVKAAENVAGNLGKLDAGVKANADAITKEVQDRKDAITKEIKDRDDAIGAAKTEITNQINTLSGNAVQYDDATKGKVTLGGGDTGTTIANLKAGTLSADSMEAVNGSQLFESNRQIALNKSSISDLSRSVDSMRSSITSNSKRIDALSKTVTEVNSNVSTTISDMASLQKNNANLDLSNLSDEGNATITQIAKNAVQSYLQSASTDAKSNASATQTMEARFASPVATFAVGSAITYDDETNSKITLGTDGSTVDILGVKGGQVYEGSTHAATGDDVFKVQEQVNGFSGTLDTINAGMSKINASLASNLKDITALQTTTATTKQKVDRGYTLDINGITAKNVTPTDNSINFKSGTNVTISNNGGFIEFAVEGNGDIAEGNTGLISGGTAFTALAEKADKDLSNLTDEAKKNIQNAMGGDMSSKANIDLDNLSEAGIAKIKSTMASDLAGKAATDASNIDAGKYAEKLGTGVVTDGDDNLVTGSTVYNAIKDLQGGTGGLITKMDVNMKNISKEGKTTIKNLSKEAVKLADGKYTTVSSEEDSEGNLTYKVNVTADGSIEDGNTGLITGDTAKKALDKKANTDLDNISDAGKNVIKDAVKDDLAKKANTDLSNLTEEGKNQIKNAVSADLETKANLDASNIGGHVSDWARVLGTGKVEKGNANLVTGDQVFSAVSVKADKTYVDEELSKKANTTDVNKALDGKANSDLSNITDAGKTVIKDTMKADMDKKADKSYVDNALASKVDKSDFDAVKDQVNQNKADLANKADKSYVDKELGKKADADNVYTKDETDKKIDSKLETVKDTLAGDLNNKVNKDGSNMDKDAWQEKLGDGKDEAGNKGLITGDTLNKALNDVRKDGTGLVRQEGDTIQIAPKADATKVDIKGMDKDGNSIDRVLTGVKTDENDASSAANVGYVQGIQSDLESQMDYMNNRLSNDIKEAGAVASALAGLHHIDYDPDNKLDFAVATAGYRGKSAAALGAFYQPNENIMFSLAGTIGSNHNAWNMGLSFKIGSGSDSPVLSRRVLGNQVQILAKQNQLLAENNEKLQQDVEDLKAKLDRLLASATLSPDVEKSIAK